MSLNVFACQQITRVIAMCAMVAVFLLIPTILLSSHANSASASDTDQAGGLVSPSMSDFWLYRLGLNLLGYAVIIVPGYLIIQYVRKSNYLDTAGPGCLAGMIRTCVKDGEAEKSAQDDASKDQKEIDSSSVRALKLVGCATILLSFYVVWGVLQEQIMTIEYGGTADTPGEKFKDSQFLVFMNRILAFTVAMIVVFVRQQPKHTAPLFKYSYSSFSNIMSAWCQYEALKFVSFPTQVLAKSCKVIPVMLMGKVVSGRTYQLYEYVTAVMISLGVFIFITYSPDSVSKATRGTTTSGVIILFGYLLFDAFTSNWQGELFKTYKMSSFQMMAGVNLFSVLFTSTTLLEQGGYWDALAFMSRHPEFIFHVICLSICSACGQVAIFLTISEFGAVTFTIIMTLRQGVAIILSSVIYSHPVTFLSCCGVVVVFAAIFVRIYYANQKQKPVHRPSADVTKA